MILVTGGTGLVGAHLLVELTKTENKVIATRRENSDLSKVEKVFSYYTENHLNLFSKIDWVTADILDVPALEVAFEDITHVYHCAALISFNPKDYNKLFKINCEGTANIVNICIANKIEKLSYVSSIATIGKDANTDVVDEESDWSSKDANVYALTKFDAEMEVWRGSQEGLKVAIINPGVILGPGFWTSGSGTLFTTSSKGYNYYPPGGTGFVAVNDVVQLLLLSMNTKIDKERFICISENMLYKDVLTKITRELNLKAPAKMLKKWQLQILWRLDWIRNILLNTDRKVTKENLKSIDEKKKYSNKKAITTFDYKFESIDASLAFCSKLFKQETTS
ncbi:NAD-dependent epimerase/dehydratase family protein [Cellulophaga baltica]|uniref:NAD-dependent epimerase/dehydratase family protein n=1 Tax=Cellulophaga TaxID=104264 RepID=UPI001C070E08|nr:MULTISPECIES: NAD-dependent epimerase/dehydratase family protein [Cellulophaga]MBU2995548.1 NAD-dependent epimerase/dehydratase family protein [Cellulophaga baltica]MDO6766942.1 NAD-dependent epimerase/dehydratase family protein [Cellulophaga sp. 1_MG-2023]